MNQRQAIAKLKKLLGRNLAYRVDDTALVGEDREAAKASLADMNVRVREAEAEMHARKKAVLDADAEYQRLKGEYDGAIKLRDKTRSKAFTHRIEVGTHSNVAGLGFFRVAASADNWDEAVELVSKAKGAA